jgi:hypothetical protein
MSSAVPHSAFAAFASRDFTLLTINQCCLTFAVLIQEVLIAFHLYQITKNPLILGLVGIMDFFSSRCLYGVVILLIVLIVSVFYRSVLALPFPYRLLCGSVLIFSTPKPSVPIYY